MNASCLMFEFPLKAEPRMTNLIWEVILGSRSKGWGEWSRRRNTNVKVHHWGCHYKQQRLALAGTCQNYLPKDRSWSSPNSWGVTPGQIVLVLLDCAYLRGRQALKNQQGPWGRRWKVVLWVRHKPMLHFCCKSHKAIQMTMRFAADIRAGLRGYDTKDQRH